MKTILKRLTSVFNVLLKKLLIALTALLALIFIYINFASAVMWIRPHLSDQLLFFYITNIDSLYGPLYKRTDETVPKILSERPELYRPELNELIAKRFVYTDDGYNRKVKEMILIIDQQELYCYQIPNYSTTAIPNFYFGKNVATAIGLPAKCENDLYSSAQ